MAATFIIQCEKCQASLKAGDKHVGKTIRCPRCRSALQVKLPDSALVAALGTPSPELIVASSAPPSSVEVQAAARHDHSSQADNPAAATSDWRKFQTGLSVIQRTALGMAILSGVVLVSFLIDFTPRITQNAAVLGVTGQLMVICAGLWGVGYVLAFFLMLIGDTFCIGAPGDRKFKQRLLWTAGLGGGLPFLALFLVALALFMPFLPSPYSALLPPIGIVIITMVRRWLFLQGLRQIAGSGNDNRIRKLTAYVVVSLLVIGLCLLFASMRRHDFDDPTTILVVGVGLSAGCTTYYYLLARVTRMTNSLLTARQMVVSRLISGQS